MTRPIHYTTQASVESFLDCGYEVQIGHDHDGDYEYVVTREGAEWRARLADAAVAS